MKSTLGVSYGFCESDTLVLRLLCNISIWEVPSLGPMPEYTLGTWFGKSLA